MQLLYLLLHHRAVTLAESDSLSFVDFSAVHTSDCNTSHIARKIKRRDKHLSRSFNSHRSGNIFYDSIEHSFYIRRRLLPVSTHPALFSRTVDGREIKLFLGRVKVTHQVKHHLLHLIGAAIGLINLVYYDHRLQTHLNGFLQHKTSLRHRTFEGIDKKQTSVSHIEHTLYLASEVCVSRSIDDIDLAILVVDRYVF